MERTREFQSSDWPKFRGATLGAYLGGAGCLSALVVVVVLAAFSIGGSLGGSVEQALPAAALAGMVVALATVVCGMSDNQRLRQRLRKAGIREIRFFAVHGVRVRRINSDSEVGRKLRHLVLVLDAERAMVLPNGMLPEPLPEAAEFSGALLRPASEGESKEPRLDHTALDHIEGPQAPEIVADDRTHAWIEACEVGEVVQIADMPRELREACERAVAG